MITSFKRLFVRKQIDIIHIDFLCKPDAAYSYPVARCFLLAVYLVRLPSATNAKNLNMTSFLV